jgi:hypothetical protein
MGVIFNSLSFEMERELIHYGFTQTCSKSFEDGKTRSK